MEGRRIYEGDRDDREVRFWGSECRSLLLVTSEMPNRDQAEKMKAAGHQGPGAGRAGKPGVGTCATGRNEMTQEVSVNKKSKD